MKPAKPTFSEFNLLFTDVSALPIAKLVLDLELYERICHMTKKTLILFSPKPYLLITFFFKIPQNSYPRSSKLNASKNLSTNLSLL